MHLNGLPTPEQAEAKTDRAGLRVLIVDDHDLFRSGLRRLLEDEGIAVAGEASDGDTAIGLCVELAPDVVVMDLNMPGLSGVETARRLATLAPESRIVVLTISAEDEDVTSAVVVGACGYLLKDSSIPELVAGIRAAAAGEALISPYVAGKLLQRLREEWAPAAELELIRTGLSEREIEVLKLIANGRDNADIARELFISPKTVKNHTSNILMKLQFENRIQAAVYAVRSGIV